MIDLHSHILPGIDDGPGDIEGSVALGRVAAADGTEVIAATPHIREDHPDVHLRELPGRVEQVNEALSAADVPLKVVVGAEVDVVWARQASDEELRLATYGQRGTDILLETPYGPLPPGFEEFVFSRLSLQGFRVLLAHPERNLTIQQDPIRLAAMVERGILVQVTATSLIGKRRSTSRRIARWAVDQGLAHVIASDAHRSDTLRPPRLAAGLEAASGIDSERAPWMVNEVPRAVLDGEPLPPVPAAPRRGRLGGLRRG